MGSLVKSAWMCSAIFFTCDSADGAAQAFLMARVAINEPTSTAVQHGAFFSVPSWNTCRDMKQRSIVSDDNQLGRRNRLHSGDYRYRTVAERSRAVLSSRDHFAILRSDDHIADHHSNLDRTTMTTSHNLCCGRGGPTHEQMLHNTLTRSSTSIGRGTGGSSGRQASEQHRHGSSVWPLMGEGAAGVGGGGGGDESALLLRMEFEDADIEQLRHWIRRYPFGTTLPVQPFSLVETEKGLDVVFRKKPTLERSSQDGGISFVVEQSASYGQGDDRKRPTLILRRISEGQEIRKMFAERIVVKAVVKCLAGDGTPPAPPGTNVCAVLHEGLV